ncbi:MAG: acyl dehydratase [Myxococcota bacterium]|jgi:acyl dehydratase
MATIIASVEDIQQHTGQALGESGWKDLPFSQIQAFADATGDHQWIHVDEERIAKESPFGAPIAHGYLTLSLIAGHFFEVVNLKDFAMIINYGCNKVRFPSPLKAGSRYRLTLSMPASRQVKTSKWWELSMLATIEIENEAKPACVAEVVYRVLTT